MTDLAPDQRMLAMEPWAGAVAAKLMKHMDSGASWMGMRDMDALNPTTTILNLSSLFVGRRLALPVEGKFYVRFAPSLWAWCRTAEAFAEHCAKKAAAEAGVQ